MITNNLFLERIYSEPEKYLNPRLDFIRERINDKDMDAIMDKVYGLFESKLDKTREEVVEQLTKREATEPEV